LVVTIDGAADIGSVPLTRELPGCSRATTVTSVDGAIAKAIGARAMATTRNGNMAMVTGMVMIAMIETSKHTGMM
jgi:hypothetical protein